MFTNEELVKIHNILLNSPMGEVEEMVTKIRQTSAEQAVTSTEQAVTTEQSIN